MSQVFILEITWTITGTRRILGQSQALEEHLDNHKYSNPREHLECHKPLRNTWTITSIQILEWIWVKNTYPATSLIFEGMSPVRHDYNKKVYAFIKEMDS